MKYCSYITQILFIFSISVLLLCQLWGVAKNTYTQKVIIDNEVISQISVNGAQQLLTIVDNGINLNTLSKMILNIFDSNNKSLNFIQIGANDGIGYDHFQQLLITSSKFHGVMVEPVPFLFDKLKQNVYSIKNNTDNRNRILLINAAVSHLPIDNYMDFYLINRQKVIEVFPAAPHWLLYELGSFNKNHIKKHLQNKGIRWRLLFHGQTEDEYIDTISVNVLTPNNIIKQYQNSGLAINNGYIDLLLIDAEGFDAEILNEFMKIKNMRPSIVVFEIKHLSQAKRNQCFELLQNLGYYAMPDCVAVKFNLSITI